MKLLEPLKVKNTVFKNRIMFPPLTTGYEDKDGSIGEQSFQFYNRLAKGGTAYIVLGDVAPIATFSPTPKLYNDSQIESYKKLADALHSYGAKLGIQIFHPEYDVEALFEYFKRGDVDGARQKLHHDTQFFVQEVTVEKLKAVLEKYGECAERAVKAGIDVIEVHGDRLVGSLCSPILNHRTDEYGGSFENRIRFALEAVAALREGAPELVIDYKLPVVTPIDETEEMRGKGGVPIEEAVELAKRLEAAGVDMFHVAQANHTGNMGDTIPAMGTRPYGFFEKYARQVKAAVSVPVSTSGRIVTPEYAEAMLQSGSCDMTGLGRPLLADPDWGEKLAAGLGCSIRQCIMCNKGCTDAVQNRRFISCVLNAENGYEGKRTITKSDPPKHTVIIGAGPAGLEAARVAALKGDRVDLLEKSYQIGGQITIASVPPRKHEMLRALHYLRDEIHRLGVTVHMGNAASAEDVLALKPDRVIIATGARNFILPVKGADGANVLDAWKVLADEQVCGGEVAVIGGGLVGVETAELLASRGCHVTVIEMLDEIAKEESLTIRPFLMDEFKRLGIRTLTGHKVKEILPDAVVCVKQDQTEAAVPCGFVVFAAGAKSDGYDTAYLEHAGIPFTRIGDCEGKAADLDHAIKSGYDAANKTVLS